MKKTQTNHIGFFKTKSQKLSAVFKKGKNSKVHEFLSKFAKAILTMIAVLPAAGLLITLGKIIGPLGLGQIEKTSAVFLKIGEIIETIGWIPFTHMGLLFAIAIGGSWSKNQAGGAFAGGLAYFVLLAVGSTIFITKTEIDSSGKQIALFMNYIMCGKWMPIDDFFINQSGVKALRFDALGGIIMGFIGASIFNKFYTFNKLPNSLAFFNGPRFVPFMVFIIVLPISCVLTVLWPAVQVGINQIGKQIATNNKLPFAMPFLYGLLERLLLPFGLHHMITIPMNYTSFGGNLDYLSADQFAETLKNSGFGNKVSAGQVAEFFRTYSGKVSDLSAEGQEKMYFTWITALGHVKGNWEQFAKIHQIDLSTQDMYNIVLDSFEPVRFKAGQMITSTGSLVGAGFGMLYAIPKSHRDRNKSIYVSGALACALTGVTEPIEFIFIFTAPFLYVIHAFLTGIAFGLVDFIPMRIHAFGGIETIIKYFGITGPTSLPSAGFRANLWFDGLWFSLTSIIFGGLYFVIFKYITKIFKPSVPGFESNSATNNAPSNQPKKVFKDENVIDKIIVLLGGVYNILEVDACMSRLRVIVKNPDRVASQEEFKNETGAVAIVQKNNSYQVIYGGKSDLYKHKILAKIDLERHSNELNTKS
ncbi:PTS sugar transporter subunit IIC [Mesoplasma syrphidae]|uniref:PTS sugar transporter subunit IIC n=1 Tax=Mesoplasma syrphidae TaxID=225999 RepID=A0A2K9BJX4_9MOLU|nr:PTS transporter subunit EIIC [Mesoplasma syrphidae]AUF83561.1 PTS sugar transporter subunit IIC [Mesoplasma syrphidae]